MLSLLVGLSDLIKRLLLYLYLAAYLKKFYGTLVEKHCSNFPPFLMPVIFNLGSAEPRGSDYSYVYCVPQPMATYIFFLFINEPGLGTLIDLTWL